MASSTRLHDELVALLPRLRRFGRALARHREDADDLVQTAVERALKRADQWEPGTRLDSWMFRIMQNAWIDEGRARRRRAEVALDEEPAALLDVAATAGAAPIEALALQRALARLPEEQRAVVALVLMEGLAYREAAEVLDIPIGTVTSRLARARDALQAMLA